MDLKAVWQRPEYRFLIIFFTILVVGFVTVALQPVNDKLVLPYTAFIAKMSGFVLDLLGEDIRVDGCNLLSPRFQVAIYNGCNGLITSLIFISGVLAFPASTRAKLIGVLGGLLAIQVVNLVRIVSLFYIGVFIPQFFNQSHIFVWQSLVILAGVTLWVFWARRYGTQQDQHETA
jgi:exosortase H (IPTLxxWG-CTERM-specific)